MADGSKTILGRAGLGGADGGRTGRETYRDMLVQVRDRVAAMRKEGKSEEEVIAAPPQA